MPTHPSHRPWSLYLLQLGLVFQGLSGLWGGGALVWAPSGQLLNMPLTLLEGSPFSSYFLPGLLLLTILGIAPLLVALAVWVRFPGAWYGALAVSCALLVWIGVQVWMVGYHADPPLQLVYGILGGALLMLSLQSGVRNDLTSKQASRS